MKRTLNFGEFVAIQNDLNEFTVSEWKKNLTVDHFRVAILDEMSELLNSTNWKWWKLQDQHDDWNLQIEIIDIFHFALSIFILNNTYHHSKDLEFGTKGDGVNHMLTFENTLNHAEFINNMAALLSDYTPTDMDNLFAAAGMNPEEISAIYIVKSQLNFFRQSGGYANGTYQKVQDGMEDNVRLKYFVDMFLQNDTMSIQNLMDSVIIHLTNGKNKTQEDT
jgi:dimeric dUTPase (all-alpha-NTP-PPase superfamily)